MAKQRVHHRSTKRGNKPTKNSMGSVPKPGGGRSRRLRLKPMPGAQRTAKDQSDQSRPSRIVQEINHPTEMVKAHVVKKWSTKKIKWIVVGWVLQSGMTHLCEAFKRPAGVKKIEQIFDGGEFLGLHYSLEPAIRAVEEAHDANKK